MTTLNLGMLESRILRAKERVLIGDNGQNCQTVEKALERQKQLNDDINEISKFIDLDLKEKADDDGIKKHKILLNDIKLSNDKKFECLETLKNISNLEENCWNLHQELDKQAVALANKKESQLLAGQKLPGFLGQLSQNCIFGVKDNWDSIISLVKCLEIHLKNASDYHQFFHEIKESEIWMNAELDDIVVNFEKLSLIEPDEQTVEYFLSEIEAMAHSLVQWQSKLDRLHVKASSLIPIEKRIQLTEKPLPAISLCTYFTSDVKIRENEDITLLDNRGGQNWKIRTGRGDEGLVPALAVLIPGPDSEALNAVTKLKFHLLTTWTNVLKNYGKRLIYLLLKSYKTDYTPSETDLLISLEAWEKENILMTMLFIEMVLRRFWIDYKGFQALQERLGVMRMILEGDIDSQPQQTKESENDNKKIGSLINSTSNIHQITNAYQDLIKNWEIYKTTLDVVHYPELMLVLQQWQQLQYISSIQFSKYWQNQLNLDVSGTTYNNPGQSSADNRSNLNNFQSDDVIGSLMVDGIVIKDEVAQFINQRSPLNDLDHLDNLVTNTLLLNTEAGQYEQMVKTIELQELPQDLNVASRTKLDIDLGIKLVKQKQQKSGDNSKEGENVFTANQYTTKKTLNKSQMQDGEERRSESGSNEMVVKVIKKLSHASGEGDGGDGYAEESVGEFGEVVYKSSSVGSEGDRQFAEVSETVITHRTDTEEVVSSKGEENRTFTISSVIDSSDGSDISLDRAIELGVIIPKEGVYVDKSSGDRTPIQVAMMKGLIKVKYSTKKVVKEKFSSIGIISIRSIKKAETPYTIIGARNTLTLEDLNLKEAVTKGILELGGQHGGFYKDCMTGKRTMIGDAVGKGLVKVEYKTDAPKELEVIIKRYAVRAAVDRQNKSIISFGEAVRKGFIDPKTGTYFDNVENKKIPVAEAIVKGLLKAKLIENDDIGDLLVDPVNHIVVDRTKVIKQKVLKPLQVLGAFKQKGFFGKKMENK